MFQSHGAMPRRSGAGPAPPDTPLPAALRRPAPFATAMDVSPKARRLASMLKEVQAPSGADEPALAAAFLAALRALMALITAVEAMTRANWRKI